MPCVRIRVAGVGKTFHDGTRVVPAVGAATFDVHEGEVVAIVGPSGCGKSTLLRMIAGLLPPSTGEIVVDGRLGYVFQQDTVLPWRTVAQNVALGLEYQGVAPVDARGRACDAIASAGLAGFEDAWPSTLSVGMRQRVALLRSLVVEPEVLLMDEPFGALDAHTKLQLHAQLLALWTARHQTVLLVTHDLAEAVTLADRVVVMTRRPGAVKLIHDVALPRARDPLRIRESSEWLAQYGAIWRALGEEPA